MFNKKILILTIFAVLFLSLSLVSAADNSTADIVGRDYGQDVSSIDDGADIDVLADGGEGSSRTDIYFDASRESDGNGSKENPYNGYVGYGRLQSNSNFHFKNGEYQVDGTGSFSNISFYGEDPEKTVLDFQGKATHSHGSFLIKNITFKQSFLQVNNDITAVNSIFNGNNKEISLITTLNLNNNNVVLDNCTFINNSNKYFGSVIYLLASNANISNCRFIGNVAENGGVIYSESSNLNIYNTLFKNNHANVSAGAILVSGGDLFVFNSTFINNSAYLGGAIYSEGSLHSYPRNTSVVINDSLFDDNHAFEGGSILSLECRDFIVNNCDFVNSSSGLGGVLLVLGSHSQISDCNFENNFVDDGASFYQVCADLKLSNSKFKNNTASKGAVFVFTMDNINIVNNTFIDNSFAIISDDENLSYQNNSFVNSAVFLNYKPSLFIGNGNYTFLKTNDTFNGTIPVKYDPRDYGLITSAKDQDNRGYCWNFGTIATLESCIVKATGVKHEFSEMNVANIISAYSDYGFRKGDGASSGNAIAYLLNWFGPVYQKDEPYFGYKPLSPILNSVFHIQNVKYIQWNNSSDFNTIKEVILRYGAVGTSLFFTGDYFKEYTYYDPENDLSNHEIAIVGWDDNYPKENFKITPPGDGAWIIKNSWGEASGNGCYYVSYYDNSIHYSTDSLFTFILNDTIRLDKNYQYDIGGILPHVFSNSTVWFKNVYNSTDDEFIAAVSTDFHKDYDWELFITVNDELVHSQSGRNGYGYYTIDLEKFVPLRKGDKFEIIFKLSSLDRDFVYYPVVDYKFSDFKGKSFISADNKTWRDLSLEWVKPQVACIKAYTFLNKIKTDISLNIDYNDYNPVNITAYILDEYGNKITRGNVIFDLEGEKYSVNVSKGIANIVHNFNKGRNLISAEFAADGYESSSANASINVLKIDVGANMNISTRLNTAVINVSTSSDVVGNGIVFIDGKNYTINLTRGIGSLTLTDLESKNYTIYFELENKTYECSISKGFTPNFSKTNIISENLTTYAHSNANYVIKLTNETASVSGKTIRFKINKKEFTEITDINGEVNVPINLSSGNYLLTIAFDGDDYYLASENNATIIVNKIDSTLTISDIIFDYGSTGYGEISFTGANGVVCEIINQTEATVNVKEGLISVSSLDAGSYTLSVTTVVDDNHNAVTEFADVVVSKVNSTLTVGDVVFDYGTSGSCIVSFEGANAITAVVDNDKAIVDIKGNVISVSGLDVGKYALAVTTVADDNHNPVTETAFITVNPLDSYVSISDIVFDYGATGVSTFILDGADSVVANVNDDNAVVSVDGNVIFVSGLDVGSYTLSVTTVADANHNPVTETVNVVVNPVDSSLFVQNIVFDYGTTGASTVVITGAVGIVAEVGGGAGVVSVDGNVIFVSGLDVGSYTLSVTTVADANHNPVTETVNVVVNPVDSSLFVQNIVFDYGTVGTSTFILDGADSVVADVIDGNAVVSVEGNVIFVSGLDVGSYTLSVTTVADANHNPVTVTANVIVNLPNSSVIVPDIIFNYGDVGRTSVVLSGAIAIVAEVAGGAGVVSVDGNVITVSSLDVGNYTLIVSTIPDANHNPVSETALITVNPADSPNTDSSLIISDIVFDYGTVGTSTFILDGADSVVADVIDGNAVVSVEGNAIFVSGLDVGSYTLSVTTVPDANHNSVTETANVVVNPVNSSVIVSDISFNQGSSGVSSIILSGAIGVTAEINDDNAIVSVNGNVITVSGLDEGSYRLTVTTVPDANHNSVTETVNVVVNPVDTPKTDSSLVIQDISFDYGSIGVSSVVLSGATGIVAEVNDNNAIVSVNGTVISVSGLDVGNYILTITTVPDDNHNAVTEYASITVNPANSSVIVPDIRFDYGFSGTSVVSVTGVDLIIAEVDDSNAIVNVDGNVISVSNLNAGNYTLTVTTVPNLNHKSVRETANVVVNKVDSSIAVQKIIFDYGGEGSSIVSFSGANSVIVDIDDDNAVVGVQGNFITVSGLNAGTHTLTVTTVPDANHNPVTETIEVVVNKVDSSLAVSDIIFNHKSSGTSFVSFSGADSVVATVNDDNAVVSVDGNVITVSGLDVGSYRLTVTTVPDANHNPVTETVNVIVNPTDTPKADSSVILNDINIDYGNNATASVVLSGATGIMAEVNDSNAVVDVQGNLITVSGLNAGTYALNVTTIPDANHNQVTKTVNIIVNKIDSALTVSDIVFDYGSVGSARASFTGSSGITALIDDDNAVVSVEGNVISISGLSPGSYSLEVTTIADANHNPVTQNVTVIVNPSDSSKPDSSLNIEDISFDYGSSGTSAVSFSGADSVVVKVNDISAVVSVDGNLITVSGLNAGSYILTVTTHPDTNHNAVSKNATVTVNPIDPILTVDVGEINAGETAEVKINANINDDVLLSIANTDYKVKIVNGSANQKITGLSSGTYEAIVRFNGSLNFNAAEVKTTFKVNKVQMPANSTPIKPSDDKTPTKVPTYSVDLPSDATGTLTVTIANKKYTSEVKNGHAQIKVSDLPAGNYDVTITYSGDDKYAPMVQTTTVDVIVDANITSKDMTMKYASGNRYEVTVYGTDGKVADGVEVVFKVKGRQVAKVYTNENGIASYKPVQAPGKYEISATSLGKTVTNKLTVTHLLTLKSVTVKKSAKKLVLQATLAKVNGKYLKSKTITFKFNGKTFKAKTDKKGVAKYTIKSNVLKKLKVGKKLIYQATYSKDTVKRSVKIKR